MVSNHAAQWNVQKHDLPIFWPLKYSGSPVDKHLEYFAELNSTQFEVEPMAGIKETPLFWGKITYHDVWPGTLGLWKSFLVSNTSPGTVWMVIKMGGTESMSFDSNPPRPSRKNCPFQWFDATQNGLPNWFGGPKNLEKHLVQHPLNLSLNLRCIYHLVMTNIAGWKIPTINGGFWENHWFLWAIYTIAMLNNQRAGCSAEELAASWPQTNAPWPPPW